MPAELKHTIVFDGEAMAVFIENASIIYGEVEPAAEVQEYLEDLYSRLVSDLATVNLAEVFQVLALFENGQWESADYATQRILKLKDRLRTVTTH